MRKAGIILIMLGIVCSAANGQEANRKAIADKYGPRLEKILQQNIIPYWYPGSLDRKNGGYLVTSDSSGKLTPGGNKMIVTQSRMVWFFSRLARAGYRKAEFLEAADLGYRFLIDKMWDHQNGGFYWEVDATGNQKTAPLKHMYGQSFALYAISEYAMASGKKDVLKFAVDFFQLLESKAHDGNHGGYIEFFSADWKPNPPDARSYMGPPAGAKLMNTHLHLMEALTTFYRASHLPLGRERLLELINIESNSVVRKNLPACTDKYQVDWTPILGQGFSRVSYGHDVENVWLLMDACDAAGISTYPFLDLYRGLFSYSHKYGFDSANGGFFDSGPFNQPADRRQKVWWVQSEALVSSLRMSQLTGDPLYLGVFDKTLDFVERHQIDWAGGEWHNIVNEDGRPAGEKASIWKAAYHNGRAMIECLELLKKQ